MDAQETMMSILDELKEMVESDEGFDLDDALVSIEEFRGAVES